MPRLLSSLVCVLLLLGGCDMTQDAQDDARARAASLEEAALGVVDRVRFCAGAVQLASALAQQDAVMAVTAAQELAASAPPELGEDVEVVLAAAESARGGNLRVLTDETVRAAGGRVADVGRAQCDPSQDR